MPIRPEFRKFYRPPDWPEVRQRILARAKNKCEQCHKVNGSVYLDYERGRMVIVQLGIAHLNHIAGDDRPENLAALCRKCHLLHDRGQHRDSRAIRKDRSRPLLVTCS